MKHMISASLFALFGNACVGQDASSRVEVGQSNDLGAQTLATEHSIVDGNRVFTLHAFGAGDREVGTLRLTTGSVPDLARMLPGSSDRGSEIIVTVGDVPTRILTRETQTFQFTAGLLRGDGPKLMALTSVASAIASEANMKVIYPAAPAPDRAYSNVTCGSVYLNTSPTALQCCFQYNDEPVWTMFNRGSDNAIVERQRNPVYYGGNWPGNSACRAGDGVSGCSGDSCYFGPNGFARAYIVGPWDSYAMITGEGGGTSYCAGGYNWEPVSPEFGDVGGSFPTGAGCPTGNGSSGNYDWDY